jgi:hypothetical protein
MRLRDSLLLFPVYCAPLAKYLETRLFLPNHFLHDELRFCGIGVWVRLGSPDHALHKLGKPFRMVFRSIYKTKVSFGAKRGLELPANWGFICRWLALTNT